MNNNNMMENGSQSSGVPQGELLPEEGLFHIALRHRGIILSTVLLFIVGAFIYILKVTPLYMSSSKLYVEQSGPKIINEYEGIMTQAKNYLFTQGELLKSTPIIAAVADNPQIRGFRTFDHMENVTAYIKKNLDVAVGKKDDIITVSFYSPYSAEAAQIVNEVVNSYVDYHSNRKRSTASEVLRILQKEKVKCDAELSAKFKQILEFTKTNGVVSLDGKGENIIFQRLGKLSEALTGAQLEVVNAKANYEAIKNLSNEPSKVKRFAEALPQGGIHVSFNDTETQLRTQLKDTEIQLKDALYECTENHPSVKAIKDKIDRIRQQLNNEAKEFADAYLEMMRLRWLTAKEREVELEASFENQREAAQNSGVKAAEYSVLQSELGRTERLGEILDNRIKELNVTEDVGALNISILEVAHPTSSPSKPEKAKIMAIALILGIMFGLGFALIRDWMDYRLRSVEEITAILGTPVIGVIPTMSSQETVIINRSQKIWAKLKSGLSECYRKVRDILSGIGVGKAGSLGVSLQGSEEDDGIGKPSIMELAQKVRSEFKPMTRRDYAATRSTVFSDMVKGQLKAAAAVLESGQTQNDVVKHGQKVHLKPKSVEAEAYRTVRTAVFFSLAKGRVKSIHITSPEPGDGKSTLASNLAIAMAQAGQKTLIIDADLRKPVQHKIFEIDNEQGLSGVLIGTVGIGQAIQACAVKDLEVLTCGPETPNPSEMLNSNLFVNLLQNLCEQYDRVIIDSPPIGPVADSQILAAICDATLLVLRAEKSTRRHSQHARDSLLSVGGNLLGVVVNDVPRKYGRYGYYSGYSRYGYGYGNYGHYGHHYEYYGNREEMKKEKQCV